jgi:hypothetical protein
MSYAASRKLPNGLMVALFVDYRLTLSQAAPTVSDLVLALLFIAEFPKSKQSALLPILASGP